MRRKSALFLDYFCATLLSQSSRPTLFIDSTMDNLQASSGPWTTKPHKTIASMVRRASSISYSPLARPDTTLSAQKSLPTQRMSICKRIGPYSLSVLGLGFILIVVAVAFLCHLWLGDRDSASWRWVILNDYVGSAVALAALAIQASVASQGAVAISMLASLVLERWGAPLGQSLAISTMRYNNSGPSTSLWCFTRQVKGMSGWKAFLFCSLMSITTIAANFSSTILLFDVRPGQIRGSPVTMNIPLGWRNGTGKETSTWFQNFMLQTPPGYQAFAEYSDRPEPSENMSDTGPLLRALLPFSSEQTRSNIQDFEGSAKVFDARVACVRPSFVNSSFFVDSNLVNFTGQVGITARPPGLDTQQDIGQQLNDFPLISFDCSVGYGTQICPLLGGNVDIGLRSWLWQYFNSTQNVTSSAFLFFESQYMLDAYNDTSNGTYRPMLNSATTIQGDGWNSKGDGPWLNLEPTNWTLKEPCEVTGSCTKSCDVFKTCGKPGLNVSLCFDAMWPDLNLPVTIDAIRSRQEPKLAFDDARNQLDVNSIAKQLGATPRSYTKEERGVMNLDINSVKRAMDDLRPKNESPQDSAKLLDESSLWYTLYPTYSGGGEDWTFCRDGIDCSYGGLFDTNTSTTLASVQQSVLMRQILNETHDPAMALSAELTILARMHYYDMASTFNLNQTTAATFFDTKSFPQETRGLAAVLAVCCAHLAIIAVVTVYFCTSTKYSLLDNAWSATSQIHTESIDEILRTSTLLKDNDVEETIRATGRDNLRVCISRNAETGRIETTTSG